MSVYSVFAQIKSQMKNIKRGNCPGHFLFICTACVTVKAALGLSPNRQRWLEKVVNEASLTVFIQVHVN